MITKRTSRLSECSDGPAALDNSGVLVAATEATGNRVRISYADSGAEIEMISVPDSGVRALALHAVSGVMAVGEVGGRVVLRDRYDDENIRVITVSERTIEALSFSPDGRLLAVGDEGGLVAVFLVSSGQELWRTDAEGYISAIAVNDLGSPVLTGDDRGFIYVHHRLRRTQCIPGNGTPVTSMAASPSPDGKFLVGTMDGFIGAIDAIEILLGRFTPSRDIGGRPVRALCAPVRGGIMALAGDGELISWLPPDEHYDFESASSLLRAFGRGLWRWMRELYVLMTSFDEVRQLMGDEIAAQRAKMLDEIEGLDKQARDRIRPVVVESATSLFESYSLGLAIRKVLKANPLPAVVGYMIAFPLLAASIFHALKVFAHLRTGGNEALAVGVMAVGLATVYMLGSMGVIVRILRSLMLWAAGVMVLAGPRMSWPDPVGLQRFLKALFPAVRQAPTHLIVPYPAWLGLAYLMLVIAVSVVTRALINYLQGPSLIVLDPRRRGLSDGLLHALLDVAYQAHIMSGNRKIANTRMARRNLYNLVLLAARIASKEWADAQRCGSRQMDRIVRDQGRAIAAEIKQWERKAAIAGAGIPEIGEAFAGYVVQAADSDWEALAGDQASAQAGRGRRVTRKILTLAIPLGSAVAIILCVHPLPQAMVPVLSFLVGLGMSRLLRWLDFGDDVDHGLAISQLLRMPNK